MSQQPTSTFQIGLINFETDTDSKFILFSARVTATRVQLIRIPTESVLTKAKELTSDNI